MPLHPHLHDSEVAEGFLHADPRKIVLESVGKPARPGECVAFALAQLPLERASKSQRNCPGGRRGAAEEAPLANDPKKQVVDVAALPSGHHLSQAIAGPLPPTRPGGGGPGRLYGHTRGPGHAKSPRP
ncbi:MAG: hypothetical protein ACK56F_21675, partial [bacterium]